MSRGNLQVLPLIKHNSYGYLSPYENIVNGNDTDFGVVVRFSTNNYISNSTNIRAVDLSNNYQDEKLTGFMGIKEYGEHLYLVPHKHSTFVRIIKSRFDDTTTSSINDISSIDLSGGLLGSGQYNGELKRSIPVLQLTQITVIIHQKIQG